MRCGGSYEMRRLLGDEEALRRCRGSWQLAGDVVFHFPIHSCRLCFLLLFFSAPLKD